MKKPYIVRNGTLYIQTTKSGTRYRFSTGLLDSKSNRAFVSENLSELISKHLQSKEAKAMGSERALSAYLNAVLSQAQGLKKTTLKTYSTRLNALNKLMDTSKDITAYNREDSELLYAKIIARGYSKNVAKSLINLLNSAFNIAISDGVVAKNPILKKKLSILSDTKQAQPFNLSEIKAILKECENLSQKWFKLACAICFFSGLRSGELLALKWENIDLKNNVLKVSCNMSRYGITSTKTLSSQREVEILPPLREIIESYKANVSQDNGFIFVNSKNKPFVNTSGEFLALWQSVLKKCNLSYRRFYTTRHSFASVMLSEGENVGWISKMLGHKNTFITLSTYAKFVKQEGKARAQFLSAHQF